LPNIGNTCYINSFLINLYFSEEFKRFFSKEDFGDPTLLALRKIFICLDRKDRLPLEKLAKEFKESLPEDFSDNNMQHDAMEFGRVMIDKLMMTKGLEVFSNITQETSQRAI
jgi:ubiquitin C-terminal hydrolase